MSFRVKKEMRQKESLWVGQGTVSWIKQVRQNVAFSGKDLTSKDLGIGLIESDIIVTHNPLLHCRYLQEEVGVRLLSGNI